MTGDDPMGLPNAVANLNGCGLKSGQRPVEFRATAYRSPATVPKTAMLFRQNGRGNARREPALIQGVIVSCGPKPAAGGEIVGTDALVVPGPEDRGVADGRGGMNCPIVVAEILLLVEGAVGQPDADPIAPLIGAGVTAVDMLAGNRRPHRDAGVLAERGPLAPGELGRLAIIFQAEQVPAEVSYHALAGNCYLAAAVMRIVKAARKSAGAFVGLGILIGLVVVPAPAFVAVQVQAMDDRPQVLK